LQGAQDFRPGGALDKELECTEFTWWEAVTDMVPYEMIKVIVLVLVTAQDRPSFLM
jgi:hypothetical protein